MLEKGASKRRERVIPISGPVDGLKTLGILSIIYKAY